MVGFEVYSRHLFQALHSPTHDERGDAEQTHG